MTARPRHPWWRRLGDVDGDVDDELRFHLEMLQRDYEARGMTPDAARRAARDRFGDVDRVEHELLEHDHRRERGRHRRERMSDLAQDVRYGIRGLRRAPGFTLVAVLTLALGIGATTAIFSVVNSIVLRPLPYREAERIAMVWMDNRDQNMAEDIHSWPNFEDMRAQGKGVFSHMAAYIPGGGNITAGCTVGECEPQRVQAGISTAELFDVIGVRPFIGRGFEPAEVVTGRDAVVVISHGLWTRMFGSDTAAIGKTIRMNGRERTVIGVMPRGFAFPTAKTDVWTPLVLDDGFKQARGTYGLYVIGRLAPGVTLERAKADMQTIWSRLQQLDGGPRRFGLNIVPLPDQVVGKSLRTALWVMLAAVAAVLLIACANVANLMLSRAAVREREVSVRLALGARRGRLVQQLLTESLLLAVVGGALGVALAWAGLDALKGLAPADLPRVDEIGLDARVLLVTVLTVAFTGIAFGFVPALQASRPDLTGALREGGRGGTTGKGGHRLRQALAASQVALVVVLLTGAGLLIRSFLEIQRVELGFREDHLLTMRVTLPGAKYPEPGQRVRFYDALLERVRALPGVEGAAATSSIFLSQTPQSTNFTIEGRTARPDEPVVEVPIDAVTPDYFRVMGVPLIRGRAFTAQDVDGAPPVVMINANMARRYWPNEDPIGRRFKYGGPGDGGGPWMTIVGVVGDMRRTGLDLPVRYETFLPLAQSGDGGMTLVARTSREPAAFATAVRGAVRAVDPDQPVYDVQTMDAMLSDRVAQRRFTMALLGTFAGLALVLGIIGVYGVTSYLVTQRTREVGLRIALGADPGRLVRMVVRQGMHVAIAGLVLGLLGALALSRMMERLLFGVSPNDAWTLLAVTLVLAVATLVANWLPARRAARVDPLVALRSE